ncbi:MAG TPA: MBL fold metallo-hydrolase [Candidatus Limnocylindria bacterium]|nr:MBL fold metallo-hydrolase [Candidatus Limnocylindria bacterium]
MDGPQPDGPTQLSPQLWLVPDTCNVYLLVDGDAAVAIDFGSGRALDALAATGARRITDVLMTHHHRDQGQGLPLAVEHGARVWVPPVEVDLFADVDAHWRGRQLLNDYNNRQDRFSLLDDVPVAGTLPEYRARRFGSWTVETIPTPGHTVGSVSLLTECAGRRLAFTGDLIAAPGRVWSLAATQWSYNGQEGLGASILSARDLRTRRTDRILPSHGDPIDDPARALDLFEERLTELFVFRERLESPFLDQLERPFASVTPHLLMNLTSNANSYVLLSEDGPALLIDYGYDFSTGLAHGQDRAARRPWLYSLPYLKQQYGVTRVEVAIPTHYHDDHVAAFNLLRDVEGTRVWAPENMVDVLERPLDHDLPCLWYDPIPVDRSLPMGRPVRWHEYEITVHALPGHTLYAAAVEFTVDGRRALAIGDHLSDEGWLNYLFRHGMRMTDEPGGALPPPRGLNYVYRNRFRLADYRETGALLRRLAPEILLFGHWTPAMAVQPEYLEVLAERGAELERLHRDLLPLDELDLGAEGLAARIRPYQATVSRGETLTVCVEALNPVSAAAELCVELVAPDGWDVRPPVAVERVEPGASRGFQFEVQPRGAPRRRARLAADVTVDGRHLGQVAEALVSVA